MIYRIVFLCLLFTSLFSKEDVFLKAPNLSRDNILETTVGVRPCRKTGVRLETESLKDKLIIHNYGYGASGLTLSFGGSSEVLRILDKQKTTSKVIAVLGAGVVGLATAHDLLDNGYEVHLYSDQWSPNLTSDIAAGMWTPPSLSNLSKEKKILLQRMLQIAEERFLKSTSTKPEFAGVKLIAYYRLTTDSSQITPQSEEVALHFDNGVTKTAYKTHRLGIDGQLFMKDLFSKVKSKGATLKQTHFDTLEDLIALEEPIIVNCLSLGSRELFNDQEFTPERGQMVHFKQEGIDYVLSQGIDDPNYWFAIHPWSDRIILGGINEPGEEELIINPETIDKIINNAVKCLSRD